MLLQEYQIVTDKQPSSISLHSSKFGGRSQIVHNSQVSVQKWTKSWSGIEDPVVLLERNFCGHPLAGLLWERQFEGVLLELGNERVPNWECLFVHRKQGLCLSVCVDDIKMGGKKLNMAPMWKKLMKNVDLDEPISFLDHACLGCTQRQC